VRYDQLVAELLVASDGGDAGPALYYTSLDVAPEKLAASTARIMERARQSAAALPSFSNSVGPHRFFG